MVGMVFQDHLSDLCSHWRYFTNHRLLLMDKTFDTEAPAQRIVMVTGGQRSGKSVFAEKLALSMSPCPVYLATAMVMDEEMRQRVEIHKQRRLLKWRNLEAPFGIEDLTISHDETVLGSAASQCGLQTGSSRKKKARTRHCQNSSDSLIFLCPRVPR